MRVHVDPDDFEASPQYNEWLDELWFSQNDYKDPNDDHLLNVLNFKVRPSYILHQLNFVTYEATVEDYLADREERIKENVFWHFPTPIAYYFYRFENSYENNIQRLLFLRDTWESIVDILHTLLIAECRYKGVKLCPPIYFSNLFSDRVADRLLNIERILDHAMKTGTNLSLLNIISSPNIDKIRELNKTRNAFSHSAAQSEVQARKWIEECYEDVIDVLEDLSRLGEVSILRYLNQVDGKTLRCDVFQGNSLTRTMKNIPLTDDQVRASQRFLRQGEILVSCGDSIFSLLPFIYFKEDESGHTTKLCMFRKTHGKDQDRCVEFEIIGESKRLNENRMKFSTEINELRLLFGLNPE